MIRLILAALRHRRAQALTVLVLTTFAVAAAVASPWYVAGAADKAANIDLANAAKSERLVTVSRNLTVRDIGGAAGAVSETRDTVAGELTIPGAVAAVGVYQNASILTPGGGSTNLPVAYREEMCAHLTIAGRCPKAGSEVLMSSVSATQLGFHVGDRVVISPSFGDPQPVTLVGTYTYLQPDGDYWAGTHYVGDVGGGSSGIDPLFAAVETFGGSGLQQVTITDDVRIPEESFRGSLGAQLGDRVTEAAYKLTQDGYNTDFVGQRLADRVALDQDTIRIGVPVGAAQLLALCWFAFFLAGRYAARERRTDVALLKLRGTTMRRQVRLIVGQSALPMLGGLLLGGALGILAARLLAGGVRTETQGATLRVSVLAALLAMLGGLLAMLLAEWRTLRTPVSELLRGVPPRRRGWRTDLVDLIVVVVAVAAAYQAQAQGTGRTAGLAPLARGLVALAIALVLARLISLLVAGIGSSALRTGRLRFALGALQVTRRPGMDRVFALLMVAVAVLCTTAVDWSAGSTDRTVRASQELGANRVINVRPDNRWHLMAAVQAADPSGTQAMAVVYRPASGSLPAVLALDSTRLAKVASWQGGYGTGGPAQLARLVRPANPDPLTVDGSSLTVRASADGPGTWLVVRVLDLDSGTAQTLDLGPLTATDTDYTAPVGCAKGSGCRLLSFTVSGRPTTAGAHLPATGPVTIQVSAVTQHSPEASIADATLLGDVTRWRTAFGLATIVLDSAHGALRLVDTPPASLAAGLVPTAYPLDAPVPMPVVVAGNTAKLWPFGDPTLSPLGGDAVPIRITGTVPALPVLGGAGVLVDLTLANLLDTEVLGLESQQVWLSASAPADIVDKLTAAGLVVLGSDSIAARTARLAGQGPTAALRFALFAALLGMLIAAASVAVAAAGETGPRATELAALRAQGVPARSARAVSYGGYAGLVLAGVLGGLVAAVLTRLLVPTGLPVFVDSWSVLPLGSGLRWYPLLLACLGALVLLGLTALVAAARLVRATGPAPGVRPPDRPPLPATRSVPAADRHDATQGDVR